MPPAINNLAKRDDTFWLSPFKVFSASVNILTKLGFDVDSASFKCSLAHALWSAMEEEKKQQKAGNEMPLGAYLILFCCRCLTFYPGAVADFPVGSAQKFTLSELVKRTSAPGHHLKYKDLLKVKICFYYDPFGISLQHLTFLYLRLSLFCRSSAVSS